MFTYYLAKARYEELLREAEQDRLAREVTRAKKEAGKHTPAQAKGKVNRRLHAART